MGKIQNFVRKYGLHLLAGATFVCLLAAILIYFIPDMYRGAKMVMTWIYNPMTGIATPQYIFTVATWSGYEIIEGAAVTYLIFIILFLGLGIANIFIPYPDTKTMKMVRIGVSVALPVLSLILVLASYFQIIGAI